MTEEQRFEVGQHAGFGDWTAGCVEWRMDAGGARAKQSETERKTDRQRQRQRQRQKCVSVSVCVCVFV
eukprot:2131269-Rhodomonas_salina.1